jgi:hypothetical protein
MRGGVRRLTGVAGLSFLAGCGSDDLLLPHGAPTQLRAVSGDGQTAPAGSPVRNPLVVEALDAANQPVPGAVVLFEFVDPPRGAAIAPSTSETDVAGRAAVAVVLGTPVGDQPVEARLADPAKELSVRFLLTAIEVPGGGGGGGDDDDDPPPEDDDEPPPDDDPPPPDDGPDDDPDGGNGGGDGDEGGDDGEGGSDGDEGEGGSGGDDGGDDGKGGKDKDDDKKGKDDKGKGKGKGDDGGRGGDDDDDDEDDDRDDDD